MKGKSSPQPGFNVKVENRHIMVKQKVTVAYLVALAKYRCFSFFKKAGQVNPIVESISFPVGKKA